MTLIYIIFIIDNAVFKKSEINKMLLNKSTQLNYVNVLFVFLNLFIMWKNIIMKYILYLINSHRNVWFSEHLACEKYKT